MNDLREVTIYTDGGADPNPGPGGWGRCSSLACRPKRSPAPTRPPPTTAWSFTAAIVALRMLRQRCRVRLVTDSQYLRRGITEWVEGWEQRGWRKRNGAPVENVDLWQALLKETARHEIDWHWVRGHRGNPERARRRAGLPGAAWAGPRGGPGQGDTTPRPGGVAARHGLRARLCPGVPGPAGYAAALMRTGTSRAWCRAAGRRPPPTPWSYGR